MSSPPILSRKIATTSAIRRRSCCCRAPKETGQAPALTSSAANGGGFTAASPQGSAAIFSCAGSPIGARNLKHGGLGKTTRRKLKTLAKMFRTTGRVGPDPGLALKPGARLVREWHGRTHTVTVTEDGFEYAGTSYSSLTKIAKKITGAHWSGPRFFGLVRAGTSSEKGTGNA